MRFYLMFQWKMHVYIHPAVALIGFLTMEASHHVTSRKDNFVAYSSQGDYGKVNLGNNHFYNIVGVGDVQIKKKDGHHILLKYVRHIPDMCMSLISVG
jgi:hypothetical protein